MLYGKLKPLGTGIADPNYCRRYSTLCRYCIFSLLKRRCNHEFRNRFVSSRVIEEWNGLPNEVKEANSATILKRPYRRHRMGTVAPSWEGWEGHWKVPPTSSSESYADRRRSTDKANQRYAIPVHSSSSPWQDSSSNLASFFLYLKSENMHDWTMQLPKNVSKKIVAGTY